MEERLRLTDEYNALKEISTRQTLEMIEVCSAGPSARCSAMLAEAREFLEWDETINDAGNYISARINADMFGTDSAGYLPLDNTSNLDRLAVDVLSQVQSGAITSEQATAQIVRSLVQRDGTAKIVGGVLEIGGVGLCAVGNVVCALGVASAVLGADKLAEGTAQIVTGKDQLSLIEQGLVAGGGYSAEQAAHIRDMLEAGTAVAALGAGGIIAITKAGKLIGVTRVKPNTYRAVANIDEVVEAGNTGGFSGITARNADEAQFLRKAEATFGNSTAWTGVTRHRGELVVQRSNIELSPQNITRLRNGQAPFVRNSSGEWEPLQLHHVGRETGQLIEVTRSQNRYNPTTGGPPHIPGPGGPIRQPKHSQTYWQERYQSFVNSGQIVE